MSKGYINNDEMDHSLIPQYHMGLSFHHSQGDYEGLLQGLPRHTVKARPKAFLRDMEPESSDDHMSEGNKGSFYWMNMVNIYPYF